MDESLELEKSRLQSEMQEKARLDVHLNFSQVAHVSFKLIYSMCPHILNLDPTIFYNQFDLQQEIEKELAGLNLDLSAEAEARADSLSYLAGVP